MSDLATMQRDFWDYLHTQAQDVPAALQARVVAPASHRLRIYRDMYLARLVEALRADFPRLATWLGDDFHGVAQAYVRARPSCDPDIGHLGQDVAAFLRRVALACATPGGRVRAHIASDLAALEWARAQVFVASDETCIDVGALRAVAPEAVGAVHFTLIEALCVVEAQHDVAALWNALGDQARPVRSALTAEPRAYAVWRRGDDVLHAPIETLERQALQAAKADATFAQICACFSARESPACAAFNVIGSWFADGWVASLEA